MLEYFNVIVRNLKLSADDDVVDRLNYFYTSSLILAFGVMVSAKQYIGTPMQCWVPAHFTRAMEQYTENYCWVQNTWWIPLDEPIPEEIEQRFARQIIYYQWVPFILLLEALMFYFPCVMWRSLCSSTGIEIKGLAQLALDTKLILDQKTRVQNLTSLAKYIDDEISMQDQHRDRPTNNRFLGYCHRISRLLVCSGRRRSAATCLYLSTKLFYCINIVLQFFLLNLFLGSKYPLFGIELLTDLVKGRSWHVSGIFPRVTRCDFDVRVTGNLHRHTVQCVLMINMFNEKIFLFLWFYFLILLAATIVSFWRWSVALLFDEQRLDFVTKFLRVNSAYNEKSDAKFAQRFVRNFLGHDGCLLLHVIHLHSGDLVVGEIAGNLWKNYINRIQDVYSSGAKNEKDHNFEDKKSLLLKQPVDADDLSGCEKEDVKLPIFEHKKL